MQKNQINITEINTTEREIKNPPIWVLNRMEMTDDKSMNMRAE